MSGNSFWSRVRKSRLVQVLAVYLGSAWVVLQVTYILQDTAGLPDWVPPLAVVFLLIGLVVVLATAWIQGSPLTRERVAQDELPGSWEVDLREMGQTLRRGRLPHLTWARALVGGVFAFWLLFGLAGLWVVIQDRGRAFEPPPAHAGPAGPGIVVVPFSTSGGELDVLQEGMVDILSTNLDGMGGYRAIAGRTVLARWREAVADGGDPDLPTVLQIARRADGSIAVVGSAVAVGPRLRLSASVHDLASGTALGRAQAEGAPDDVLGLVDELSVQILATLLADAPGATVPIRGAASLLTSSVPALRAYLEGEAAYRRSDFQEAADRLREAVAHDSTFALAHFRLSEAYGWISGTAAVELSEGHAARAGDFPRRLSPRDALLLDAYLALKDGSPRGFQAAEEAVRRYPDDPDAWYFLGDLHVHMGERALADPDEARRALERAVALDPDFAPFWLHLIEQAISRGQEERARELMEGFASIAPASQRLHRYRLQFDLVFGDDEVRAATLAILDTMDLATLTILPIGLQDPPSEAARELITGVAARRSGVPWGHAQSLFRRGKIRELSQLMEATPDPLMAMLARNLGSPHAEPMVQAALTFEPSQVTPQSLLPAAIHAAQREDWTRFDALRTAGAGLATEDSTEARGLRAQLAALDAYGQLRDGDVDAAISGLNSVREEHFDTAELALVDQWTRWNLGRLLASSGRPQDALPYLRSMQRDWPPFRLEIARIHAARGEVEAARKSLQDLLIIWNEADEDLPPHREARDLLARLTNAQEDP
jgi:tetratricopeptide (TPR) repeat protein/TolB-like protein